MTNSERITEETGVPAPQPPPNGERVIYEQTVYADGQATTRAVERSTTVIHSTGETLRRRYRRARRVIYFIAHVITIFIIIRIVLLMAGANPENAFASFIYGLTGIFVAPFEGLFGVNEPPTYGLHIFEGSSLVAIAIYYLFAWIFSRIAAFAILHNKPEAVEQPTTPATADPSQ